MAEQRQLSEQEQVRRQEVQALREMGVDPYPAAEFPVSHSAQQVLEGFAQDPEAETWRAVTLAGRLMNKRVMGKASFAVLQDHSARLQLYLSRDDLAQGEDTSLYNQVFKKHTSLGDFVGVKGFVFATKTGETTLHVQEFSLLGKTLRPLPTPKEKDGEVYDAFTDPEQRYRMRYVDLVVNPQVKDIFYKRSLLLQVIREQFLAREFLEAETPVLQPIHGGALARPFVTHHNALDMPLYLRIANELYLKRLIVGGFNGVFEFSRNFRNEGMGRYHNPEFTVLEVYAPYRDYYWLMDLMEQLCEQIALRLHGTTQVDFEGHTLDFGRGWKRMTFFGAIEAFTGKNIRDKNLQELYAIARELGLPLEEGLNEAQVLDEFFGEYVETKLIQPTIVYDYPLAMSPLAKKHRSEPGLVERFEVVCAGKEICNAYSELNDPQDQRERFEAQLALREGGDEEAMALDEDFLRALEYGMPPTAGLGIGVDRLVMLMTNASSIQEVLFFPQMRPEKPETGPDSPTAE